MLESTVPQVSPPVKSQPEIETMPRTLTICRNQAARIADIFAHVTGGEFQGCAGTQGRCTAEVARNIYATNLQAKLKMEPNGRFVIDLPYGWIYLSVAQEQVS